MQVTLSQEDQDILKEMMQSDSWKALNRLCGILVDNQARAVLTCRPEELASARARFDGANILASALNDVRRQIVRGKED